MFLLDEHQVVKPGELGTVAQIQAHAERLGLEGHRVDLDGQFRCGGSEEYVRWVQRLLGLAPGGPIPLAADPSFEVHVVQSPEEMEAMLASKALGGYGARMAAGYCWPWSEPRRDSTLVPDVRIGSVLAKFLADVHLTQDGDTLTMTQGGTVLTLLDKTVATPDKPIEGPRFEN